MGEDEVHYGPCNTACGKGSRQKITYSFLGGSAIVTTEECDTGLACVLDASTCPGVDPVTPVGPVDPTAINPTTEEIIIKPTTGGNTNNSGVTAPVDPGTNGGGEVITAGVRAVIGSIVAILFALML